MSGLHAHTCVHSLDAQILKRKTDLKKEPTDRWGKRRIVTNKRLNRSLGMYQQAPGKYMSSFETKPIAVKTANAHKRSKVMINIST